MGRSADKSRTVALIAASASVIGVSFGLARYGYGLLLPEIRATFELSSGALGAIAAGAYAAYLLATLSVTPLVTRFGPRVVVVLGGAVAVAGMALLAVAGSPAVLAVGVFLGGASGGLVFPPLSDAVARLVRASLQPRALSMISAGTGWGVLVSVPVALAVADRWRLAWAVFAGLALAATVWAAVALRGAGRPGEDEIEPVALRFSWFVCPRSGPLLAGAFVVGLGSSVYWTFAVDFVAAGRLSGGAALALLGVVGVASVLGSLAGDLLRRFGARAALRGSALLLAASLCLLAVAPGSLPLVLVSGAAFGAAYNVVIAIQSIWSARVFEQRPSTGLAAVMFMLGAGLLAGPVIAGLLADAAGLETAFLAGAAVVALVALLPPREDLAPRAAASARG